MILDNPPGPGRDPSLDDTSLAEEVVLIPCANTSSEEPEYVASSNNKSAAWKRMLGVSALGSLPIPEAEL